LNLAFSFDLSGRLLNPPSSIEKREAAKMGRIITLSVAVLMTIGATGVVLAEATNKQRDEAARTGKTVVHDVTDENIGPPAGRLATPPDTNYGSELEARAQKIFGLGQTREREEWMADQKQRAIENEINRTKPLVYPVGGR
jgi:hypothetical protein